MSLPALPNTADTRAITERVNVLIRDYNNPPASQRQVPTGVVLPFAGASAPAGFLLCNGAAVSRADYADLFAAIGTTYGAGNGTTTFNVPDLRGRVAAGKDDMGGSAANRLTTGGAGINGTALGAAGGAQTHVLTVAQMPSHVHGLADPTHSHGLPAAFASINGGQNFYAFLQFGGGDQAPFYYNGNVNNAGTGQSVQSNGFDNGHNNTQPTLVLNHIIST